LNSAFTSRVPYLDSNIALDLFKISGLLCSLVIDTMIRTARTLTIEQTEIEESPFLETLVRKE
jgi:hypothetical protein